jgi:hypothetical protein
MAILTGKPSSISANTTSSSITLSTEDLLTLIDSATVDPYWKDAARIKSVSFMYRNSSKQKVSLKFTLPSTSSTISVSENARNGALTCEKITIIGKANDILVIPRASFTTASEFDMAVTNGYSSSSISGVAAITWADPITSAASTYVAELDGGIYKNGGPIGPSAAYDLLLKSTQELNSSEGYIEIDATLYSSSPLSSTYSYGYAVGINSGTRGTSGNYDNIDFAVVYDGSSLTGIGYYQNGTLVNILPSPQSPQYSPGGGGGMPTQTSFKNKIRIQLKNNNVEFFLNNIKYDTLVGALASINYPLFAEVSLKNSYIEGQPTIGSGFPSSRISSSISNPGTIVRSVDFTEVSEDPYSYPNNLFSGSITKSSCTRTQGSFIEFAQGNYFGNPTDGEAFSIRNVGASAQTGEASFYFPLVEGNNYIVRLYIHSYINAGSNPSISIISDVYNAADIVTVTSSAISSAVGSYVDVLYTPSVYKSTMPPSEFNPNPAPMANDSSGVVIFSNNTDDTNIIRISKIEFIEA